jgi:uncharacterized protein YjbJ (UPF0337 family)
LSDRDLEEEGRHDQSVGQLEKAIGEDAGIDKLETEGRVREAVGEVKEGLGEAADTVDDAADDARDALKR